MARSRPPDPLAPFHPVVRDWFQAVFRQPTAAQVAGWKAIATGRSTLISAPTGSGKTLAAFLWAIDRLMFAIPPPPAERCRVLYVSPLKALAVDVERNLRSPLVGIARLASDRGETFHEPAIAIRTGDTPASEREKFRRHPADILITTPESLFLMLTSRVREALRTVETVIIDEIHALVPGKRGSHLALSLERLELLTLIPLQRIGLSATQRPLEEVARFLGGVAEPPKPIRRRAKGKAAAAESETPEVMLEHQFEGTDPGKFRPVDIVETGEKKRLDLRVEVPVEDMAKLAEPLELTSGPAGKGPARASIWPAIHPRLLELIRSHRSTLVFVNSRRLAERLAGALNELAGETIVHAHHGSIARAQRVEIEDKLKSGQLPALIATSSLELGIDMGAIDLVVQIEAPPSVASGMQRIGRASHHVGEMSSGVIIPKYRGDLLACASLSGAMLEGEIEPISYPRNPLDVLAQQIVAMTAMEKWTADALYDRVRRAAPFAGLGRSLFDGILDMLSGKYPSDEFAELRPRINWDRIENGIVARAGAQKIAIANAGTIPDRGMYGVFLAGSEKPVRVGELDEEMVFETSPGEVFVLGASSWRVEEITHDRVLVTPAPGEPGKMPFWKGDAAGRTVGFGRRIGELTRKIHDSSDGAAMKHLQKDLSLDPGAARNLVAYIREQAESIEALPDDRTIVIERVRDELGDWRVCVLSPLGGKVLAPWAMAVLARIREERGIDLEAMWSDDGFVVRFPDTPEPPDSALMIPGPEEIERLVVRQLGSSSLFAARFREAATRALLLPRKRPGQRAPLWQQRKRASDLLQVASRFGSFPILLETFRECLRDVFDLPALTDLLRSIRRREVRVVTVDTESPSPFAASLLFRYVANYLYDGDAPLAERRAQALTIDRDQLRELLGEADFRQLLDPRAVEEAELLLQHLGPHGAARSADGVHDLLLRLGDLSPDEIAARSTSAEAGEWIAALLRTRRIIEVSVGSERRLIAAEEAAKYRDALGVPLPPGLPESFLDSVPDPLGSLAARFSRTRGPFTTLELAARYGLGRAVAEGELEKLTRSGRLVEGEFRPGGVGREWIHPEVLETIRRKSLAILRKEIEPVEPEALARLLISWQGVGQPRRGLNALLDAVEVLQGYPLIASTLESEILPARIAGYRPSDLDTLMAAGEVVWAGLEPLGDRDGRIALYLTEQLPLLHLSVPAGKLEGKEKEVVDFLRLQGASFFAPLHAAMGGGFPVEAVDLLWNLVFSGVITNDSMHALRAFTRKKGKRSGKGGPAFRSRRSTPAAAEGRWTLVESMRGSASGTEKAHAIAQQLLTRYGVVCRETMAGEAVPGGFSSVYDVFRRLEESGRVRRGYFVGGLTAMQFAVPGAIDLLRSFRDEEGGEEVVWIAATDPANPWGTIFRWPEREAGGPTRSAGTSVMLVDGRLVAHLGRGERQIRTFLPPDEPDRGRAARAIARTLASRVTSGERKAILVEAIDGTSAPLHPLAEALKGAGFQQTPLGLHLRGQWGGFQIRGAAAKEDPEQDESEE
ncbi:MAG: DEAD/DEAH box helicase [Thermoanaerobaculia bacterium]